MDNHLRAAFRHIAATEGECLDFDDWTFLQEICQKLLQRRGFTVEWQLDYLEQADYTQEIETIMTKPGRTLKEIAGEKVGSLNFLKLVEGDGYHPVDINIEPKPGEHYIARKKATETAWSMSADDLRGLPFRVPERVPENCFCLIYGPDQVMIQIEPNLTLHQAFIRAAVRYLGVDPSRNYTFTECESRLVVSDNTLPESRQAFIVQRLGA